ncbi:methyltransferase family protein [Luteimonas sp. A649]
MRWLETRVPPLVVLVLMCALAFGIAELLPSASFSFPVPGTLFLLCVGLALNIIPKVAFRRAGTTVNPLRPAKASQLVTSGVYRFTRNPMYLGHALMLLGWALYLGNLVALGAVPVLVLYLSRFQIRPEETQLLARFPDAYAAFCRQVPRWL